MNDTSERIWTWFKDYYAANFVRLSQGDGLEFWRQFIDKCEKASLLAAIDELAGQDRSKKGKPKLGEVKRYYFEHRKRIFAQNYDVRASKSACDICKNVGHVTVYKAEIEQGVYKLLSKTDVSAWENKLYDYMIPCICARGVVIQNNIGADHRMDWGIIRDIHKVCV